MRPTRLAECHDDKRHMARGMCAQCYSKWHYAHNRRAAYEKQRQYRLADPERRRRMDRAKRKANPGKYRAKHKEWSVNNKDKIAAAQKKYHAKHPGISKEWYLRRQYGISIADYEGLLRSQNGLCAICDLLLEKGGTRKYRPNVDHCHKTLAVRGILCDSCNKLIGIAAEDTRRLEKAIQYLKRTNNNGLLAIGRIKC